jgi:uncharacterized protein
VISGLDAAEFGAVLEVIATRFLPHKVVAPAPLEQAATLPLLADRPPRESRTTTYVCERFTCQAPVVGVAGIQMALGDRTV